MFYRVLEGVRVIECGHFVTAPFCAKILADLGAEVIKIEDPDGGDQSRRREPFLNDIPGLERSGLFLYLNMNKLGITLNLRTTTGRKIFAELLKSANAFVENNPPKKAEELGISYRHVKEINPSIVMTSITPFGQAGPYKDYKNCELINAHTGGAGYASTRETDISQEPLKFPARLFSFQAGLSAAAGTMGALYRQSLTGLGEHLDVSEQDSVAQNLAFSLLHYCYGKMIPSRTNRLNMAPAHILPCKDGYVSIGLIQEVQWQHFLEVMGSPDWGDNELFKDMMSRAQYWDGLKPLIMDWTMEHTKEEIFRTCQGNNVPVGALYTTKDILNSKQIASRGFIVEIEHPETGKLKYPGVPYRFSEAPQEAPVSAPLLGQHNEEIYCHRLGYSKLDLVKLKEANVI